MAVEPRSHQRRPVQASPGFPEVGVPPSFVATPEHSESPAPSVPSRHIPRYIVLQAGADDGASTATTTGAHKFPGSPSPVIGASLGLMGYSSLPAACRPWQRRGKAYRVAPTRTDRTSGQETRALSSSRFPKV